MDDLAEPFSPATLAVRLGAVPRAGRWYVAFSGGADSTALLHALVGLRQSLDLPELRALHVNHGLHPDAAAWAVHCEHRAAAWGVRCEVLHVRIERGGRRSLEEAARLARYGAFAARLEPGAALLTAHHADDQAETLLLNLVKGAGAAGLAAMPAARALGSGWLLRPLLGWRRRALLAYLDAVGERWLDDPSNTECRHDRNFLRHEVLPLLERRWPALTATLGRVSAIQSELDEVSRTAAADDLTLALAPDGSLRIAALRALSPARGHNLLRHWLRADTPSATASRRQIERIRERFVTAAPDADPLLRLNDVTLRRYRARLYKLPARVPPSPREYHWALTRPLEMTELGLHLEPTSLLQACPWLTPTACVRVRMRQGGERFHPRGVAHSNTLKHWLQVWAVPPWRRAHLPLVFEDDHLIAVIGYGVAVPARSDRASSV
ncbi:MAG: tRNA lysidine(34) synthetase TilS [Thiotrichales bacterium]